jgi:hypothetical protein
MHQRVDHDQTGACGEPPFPLQIGPEQEIGQSHRDDLAADPVNGPERPQESLSHPLHPIGNSRPISVGKLLSSEAKI